MADVNATAHAFDDGEALTFNGTSFGFEYNGVSLAFDAGDALTYEGIFQGVDYNGVQPAFEGDLLTYTEATVEFEANVEAESFNAAEALTYNEASYGNEYSGGDEGFPASVLSFFSSIQQTDFPTGETAFVPPVIGALFPPVIDTFVPATGAALTATQPISFNVTDAAYPFRRIVVMANYGNTISDVVYDGVNFGPRFSTSARTPVADGFHYVIVRDGVGWPGTIVDITIIAIGIDGSEASPITYSWTATPFPVVPAIFGISPATGTTLTATQSVALSITDADSGFARIVIVANYGNNVTDIVHNGTSFGPRFSTSSRNAITNGFSYSIVRDGLGWPGTSLVLSVYAVDATGNMGTPTDYTWVTTPAAAQVPTVTNLNPASGSALFLPTSTVAMWILDPVAFASIFVLCDYGSGDIEMVWNSLSNSYSAEYGSFKSNAVGQPGGSGPILQFTRLNGGFRASPFTIRVIATDVNGTNLTAAYNYTCVPGARVPTLSGMTPATGTTITASQAIFFQVAESAAQSFQVYITADYGNGLKEVVYDWINGWGPRFIATSTLGNVANGNSFNIIRDANGWPGTTLKLNILVFDNDGDQVSPQEYTWTTTGVPDSGGAGTTTYLMRAFRALSSGYVYWEAENDPDITGAQSGFATNTLSDIVTLEVYIV